MNVYEEIRNALLGMNQVTALVGSDSATARIWNSWQRVNAYPCIVVEVDREKLWTPCLDTGKIDLVAGDITITCRDVTRDGSDALAAAVKKNGTNPGTGLAGYDGTIYCWLEESVRSETPKNDGSPAHWYDQVMSFNLFWSDPY